jgi:predicted Zn-dependent protease
VRWVRNQISTAGEVRDNIIIVTRNIRGASGRVWINDATDAALVAAARQAEALALRQPESPESELVTKLPLEPLEAPQVFSNATYQLDAEHRAETAVALFQRVSATGMLSAGTITVLARSLAILDSFDRVRYFPYTQAQYSVTVRDPQGTASGWAGLDHYDWTKINGEQLTTVALDKCLQSRNPVAIEPGRYTTILEPQAVGDLVGCLLDVEGRAMELSANLSGLNGIVGPFNKVPGLDPYVRFGERVIDERVTISADPRDPELGFPPFSLDVNGGVDDLFSTLVYHPVIWIEKGVLTNLAYDRMFAIATRRTLGQPNSGAFRMSVTGPTTSIDEMVATTKRGILVTRLDSPILLDFKSQLYRGYTRDGVWLIENGKVSKPIKNLAFTESPIFALNNIEQLGVPQRVYHAGAPFPWAVPQPRVVPPLKVRDFSFTALTDAI